MIIKDVDSIAESILVNHPDLNDLNTLVEQIESATLKFIKAVEGFLFKH